MSRPTTKQQLRQGRANFSKRDRDKYELDCLKRMIDTYLGRRGRAFRSSATGVIVLEIDSREVLRSRQPAKIEQAILEAALLIQKQRQLTDASPSN